MSGLLISGRAQSNIPEDLRPVKLQLKWKHQFQFAGYYAAIEKGFYKEAQLDVKLLEAVEGVEPAESVFNGKADFGVSTPDIVLMRNKGKKAVVLASIFQHSAQILIASQKAGIEHIHDLCHKRIDMEPHAADLITFMTDEGLDLNDCIFTDHAFNVDRLLNGEVDAMSAYSTDEPFILQKQKFEYTIIAPAMGGIDFYGDILFTSEDLIDKNPELVKAFVDASLKGWEYALKHPDEIIELILSKYSSRHTKEHLQFEAQRMQRLIMPDVVEIGYSNKGRWKQIIETYKKTGMLEKDATIEGLLYKDYLPDYSIAWESVIIFLSVIFVFISVASFYFYTTQNLKREIHKREEIQQTLIESENRLSLLMQQSPSVIEVYDLNGLQISVNKAYEDLWTFPASRTLRKFNILKSKEVEDSGLINYVKKAYNGESVVVPEYKFDPTGDTEARGAGRVRWLSTRIYPLKDKIGRVRNIVITHEDVTERKKAEEELQKHKEQLEELVKERTRKLEEKNQELEHFNKLFVGREIRINELKEKIAMLEKSVKTSK